MTNQTEEKDTIQINVHVDKKLHACIKAQAKLAEIPLQEYVTKILKENIEDIIK